MLSIETFYQNKSLPFRYKPSSLELQYPDLPQLVPFLEAGQQTLLKPGLFLYLEHYCDCNKVHSVQVIAAVSKVVPSSVLCALTDFCYVCFAFSAFSQEEKAQCGDFLVWFYLFQCEQDCA